MFRIAMGLLSVAAAALAQAPAAAPLRAGGGEITMNFGGGRFAAPAVQGAPYSAKQINERQQTLADGTHIQQPRMEMTMSRDSQGRTRTERPMMVRPDGQQGATIVEIMDPVAGVQYTLDPQNKIAHRVTLQPLPRPNAPGGAIVGGGGGGIGFVGGLPLPSTAPGVTTVIAEPSVAGGARAVPPPRPTIEKLGTQVMENVLAEGQRITMTIPAGSQGNDRDMHVITETWNSPDLKMAVYRKMSDPRNGDNIMRLTNISRSEPDPQLFRPPADYQVVDETGPFTIHYLQ